MKLYHQFHDWAGMKVNGVSVNIDLVNGCCLACPSCAIGSMGTKRKGVMSISLFKKILDKLESECRIRHLQLYMYSDPCLHKDLHLFVGECTKRGIKTWISTMLQITNCDFKKVIEARPTEFRISFPGWEKMEYYQKNAKPEKFDKKFQEVTKLPRYPETIWTMAFHVYKDNYGEIDRARQLAYATNLKFVPLPAIFMPLEKYVDQYYTEQDKELIGHLIESPEEGAKTMKRTDTCVMWKQLAIDANGDLYLCQLVYEERFRLGMNFLEHPLSDIQKKIRTHPYCGKCLEMGGNVLQECYAEFTGGPDPIGEANKRRRLN
jgi:MoaA/NifB/PqqE/SkfB family radical SAM enzyme